MVSRVFKTALLVLFLLLNGCGDSPTGPVADIDSENPTTIESPNLAQGNLFPLEEGANWEYSLYYLHDSQGSSTAPCLIDKEYGHLNLEVTREKDTGNSKIFEIQLNFVIDSTYHQTICDTYCDANLRDTTFTNYNVLDTAFTRTLELANDTIWFRSDDSLIYMMPNTGIEGSTVYLDFFYFDRFETFSRNLSFAGYSESKNAVKYYYDICIDGLWKLDAEFLPESGGLSSFSLFRNRGDLSHINILLEYQLLEYSPATK
jgi:hypothetical protein